MEKLNLSNYDKHTLQKILSEQAQVYEVFRHLRGHQKINLVPFLEDSSKYLDSIPERSLIFKCLRDIKKLHQIYLLDPHAELKMQGFVDDMKERSKGKDTNISQAFNFYCKAVFQLTNIHNPLHGRLEGLKLYGLGSPLLKSIDLLSQKKLGGALQKIKLFDKKDIKGRDRHIKDLLKTNPTGTLYKILWGMADKEIIGDIKLSTFENHCSRIKRERKKISEGSDKLTHRIVRGTTR